MTIGEYAEQNDLPQMKTVTIGALVPGRRVHPFHRLPLGRRHVGADAHVYCLEQEGSAFASTLQCSVTPLIPAAGEENAILLWLLKKMEGAYLPASTGYAMDEGKPAGDRELAFCLDDDANRHKPVASSQSAEYPSCGVRIPMRLTAFSRWPCIMKSLHVTDKPYAATEDGVVRILDANGNALPMAPRARRGFSRRQMVRWCERLSRGPEEIARKP